MNDVLKTIKNRRSVRQYQDEQIKDEELEKILESAIYAPNGANTQSWYFTVIQNKDLINQINDGAKEVMKGIDNPWIANMAKSEEFNIFHNAPTVIIVSAKKETLTPTEDCSAATQNMLLAAESMNIGSCWIGFAKFYFLNKENLKKFNIPEDHEIQSGVALGYKVNENPQAPTRNRNVFNYFR